MILRNCRLINLKGGAASSGAAGPPSSAVLEVRDCTFASNSNFIYGAAIVSGANPEGGSSTLLVTNCTFASNTAENAPTIYNGGVGNVTNCTFSDNHASNGPGGAIYNASSGVITVRSCTFISNTATQGGSDLYNDKGGVEFGNNIFVTHPGDDSITNAPDGDKPFVSTGHNISSGDAAGGSGTTPGGLLNGPGDIRNTDPRVDPTLRDNGGPTRTHALLADSPAINVADDTRTLPRDQRGYVRPDAPDIGAFEFKGTIPVTLANISTRLRVQTGNAVLIAGFIVTGSQPKRVIIRAIGPSLPFSDALADPQLQIFNSGGNLVASNGNWQEAPNKQAIIDSGVAPTNPLESAVLRSLPPGAYTAVASGVNNTTGIGLVEAYDLDRTVNSKLANISTRGLVQTGDDVMIGGFIVLGEDSQRVIIRALGPSLPLPGKLGDPQLQVYNNDGMLIAANDNWRTGGQEAAIIATGVAPTNNLESAVVRTLPPGNYAAVVKGVSNAIGLALVEVYGIK